MYDFDGSDDFSGVIGFLLFLVVVGGIIWWITIFSWRGAEVEAKIYNEKFGTTYQARDFFYSGTEIKKLWEAKVPERAKALNGDINVNLKGLSK